MSVEKLEEEDIRRAKFPGENGGCEKRTCDKRPVEEITSVDEGESSVFKERKRGSLVSDAVNEEGTCVISSLSHMSLCPLLCTHVFCCCYGSNNCVSFRLIHLLGYTCP